MKKSDTPGRKYNIAVIAMWQGFAVTIGAIVAVVIKTDSGPHVAAIVGSFAAIQMVGVGAFNIANGAVSGIAAYKQNAPSTVRRVEEVTVNNSTPTEQANG